MMWRKYMLLGGILKVLSDSKGDFDTGMLTKDQATTL